MGVSCCILFLETHTLEKLVRKEILVTASVCSLQGCRVKVLVLKRGHTKPTNLLFLTVTTTRPDIKQSEALK